MRWNSDDEYYRLCGVPVNVSELREWAEQHNLPVHKASVASIAALCGFDGQHLGVFFFDPENAKTLPSSVLREPGIILKIQDNTLLVDGTHRAYRRWKANRKTMPVYLIEDREVIQKCSRLPDTLWDREPSSNP